MIPNRSPRWTPSRTGALILAVLLGWSTPPSGAADDPPRTETVLASDPIFGALLTDGSSASGRIRSLGADGTLGLIGEDGEREIPLGRLVKLVREGPPPRWPPEGTLAVFPEGDRLRAIIGPAGEETLEARSFLLGDVAIPIDAPIGLILTPPDDEKAYEDLLARVREEPRDAEVLWLANGDRLSGGFLGLTPRQVRFQVGAAPRDVDRTQVTALGFDPRLASYPRPEGDFLEITLVDGSRLGIAEARVEAGQVRGTTRFGAPIAVALGDLAQIHARTGSIAYLSDRKPDASDYVAYVGPTRPFRRDLNVEGRALRLEGRAYDRGIGTQSRTLLAYRLDKGDRRFQATIGLDDDAGPLGSVVFRVSVDGKDRLVTPPMTANDPPRDIDVDVEEGKVLILVTEFGDRGEVRDLADWAEARLIR